MNGNGDFIIEKRATKEQMKPYHPDDLANCFNFGPALVMNGEKLSDDYYEDFNYSYERHRRAAIAQVKKGELEYLCIVSEGTDDSKGGGMTLEEFTDVVASFGVETAYNLDGGNSSALIYLGEKINAKTNPRHRPLSDIIYFASAVEAE